MECADANSGQPALRNPVLNGRSIYFIYLRYTSLQTIIAFRDVDELYFPGWPPHGLLPAGQPPSSVWPDTAPAVRPPFPDSQTAGPLDVQAATV